MEFGVKFSHNNNIPVPSSWSFFSSPASWVILGVALTQTEVWFFHSVWDAFPSLMSLPVSHWCFIAGVCSCSVHIGVKVTLVHSYSSPSLPSPLFGVGRRCFPFLTSCLWALLWDCRHQCSVDERDSSQFWAKVLRSVLSLVCLQLMPSDTRSSQWQLHWASLGLWLQPQYFPPLFPCIL